MGNVIRSLVGMAILGLMLAGRASGLTEVGAEAPSGFNLETFAAGVVALAAAVGLLWKQLQPIVKLVRSWDDPESSALPRSPDSE